MTQSTWFVLVGGVLILLGLARLAASRDWIVRLLALNITSAGALVLLVAIAGRGDTADPVPHALALTGIVITVAVTGVGLVLTRLVSGIAEQQEDAEPAPGPDGGDGAR
ncbi:MAG: NADH-quinone oxidoreductase subunit K [Propionibacteriaceae bacterium]|nr:NADH-quinone oxidoreductase subunit K [Propionibacteriaceae bacterium]